MEIEKIIDWLERESEQTKCFIKAHESWMEPSEIRERRSYIERDESIIAYLKELQEYRKGVTD